MINTYQSTCFIIVQIHQFTPLFFGQLAKALLFFSYVDEWFAESEFFFKKEYAKINKLYCKKELSH